MNFMNLTQLRLHSEPGPYEEQRTNGESIKVTIYCILTHTLPRKISLTTKQYLYSKHLNLIQLDRSLGMLRKITKFQSSIHNMCVLVLAYPNPVPGRHLESAMLQGTYRPNGAFFLSQ